MLHPSPRSLPSRSLFSVLALALLACSPEAVDNAGKGSGGSGSGGRAGGSGGQASGGSGGASTGGTIGAGGGSGGTASGGASGASGGAGGSGLGGSTSPGSGGAGAGGRGGAGGGAADGGTDSGGTAPTFTKVFSEILMPGCTAPNGACHSTVRDQYFHFADKARAYMLLVNNPPAVGTIPPRVNTLLSYVTPQMAGGAPRMPPQSGPNLGNPPVRKPPLTVEQIATIRMWAMSGAKND